MAAYLLTSLLALAIVVYGVIHHFLSPRPDPREPPVVPSIIPFIGHIIGLVKHGGAYYTKLRFV